MFSRSFIKANHFASPLFSSGLSFFPLSPRVLSTTKMQQIHSTLSSAADIPFPNVFNSHCDICSHPIAPSDINILQPCCCGPFHSYCITNLELQARDANPTNVSPHLQCPLCRFTVTAITSSFVNHVPLSTRPPFTTSSTVPVRPAPASSPIPCPQRLQPPCQPLLPVAIHDIRPASFSPLPPNPTRSPYPNPTAPPNLPDYSPTHKPPAYHAFQGSASFPNFPTYRPMSSQPQPPPPPPPPPPAVPKSTPYHSAYPHHTIPTAPPISQQEQDFSYDLKQCFPPPSQDFKPQAPHKTHQPSAHATRRRQVSNFAAESRTKGFRDSIGLPSPHKAVPPSPTPHRSPRRQQSHFTNKTHPKANSPNTIVIQKQVSEEDIRKGLYGDSVYEAYIEGKAKLLRENPPDFKRQTCTRNVKVQIEMDLHLFHHYKPQSASPDAVNDRGSARDRERRKGKPAERSWWKSPRAASTLDSKERRYRGR